MTRTYSRRSSGALLAAAALAGAIALVAAACGGTSSGDKTKTAAAGQPKTTVTVGSSASPSTTAGTTTTSGTPAAATGSATTGGTTVKIATAGSLGQILTDASGLTLYTYKPDVANSGKSAAPAALLNAWPPLYVTGTVTKPSGLTGDLGTFMTSDGKQWVTYKGLPLYHFASDTAPGDAKGQGLGGVWFVAMP